MNFIGFHGTTSESANNIISNKAFQFDSKSHIEYKLPNDLGYGAYFFIDDDTVFRSPKDMATDYVKKYKTNSCSAYSILEVNIETDYYLDLDDKDNLLLMDRYRTSMIGIVEKIYTFIKKKHPKFKNSRYNLDGILIELLLNPEPYLEPWLTKLEESKAQEMLNKLKKLYPFKVNGELFIPDVILKRTFTNINSNYKISSIPNGRELCLKNNDCIIDIKKVGGDNNE